MPAVVEIKVVGCRFDRIGLKFEFGVLGVDGENAAEFLQVAAGTDRISIVSRIAHGNTRAAGASIRK